MPYSDLSSPAAKKSDRERGARYRATHVREIKALHRTSHMRAKVKATVFINGLRNVPCMDCLGRFPPECMDFDHTGPKVKNISRMASQGASIGAILDEIKRGRCEVVCANCHRIRTTARARGCS